MNCSGRTNLEQKLEAFFTARQQSCGKVMFPVVSVCPQGWAPVQGPDPRYSIQGQGTRSQLQDPVLAPPIQDPAQPPANTFKHVQLGPPCTGTPRPIQTCSTWNSLYRDPFPKHVQTCSLWRNAFLCCKHLVSHDSVNPKAH